jgi:hypothetical protein
LEASGPNASGVVAPQRLLYRAECSKATPEPPRVGPASLLGWSGCFGRRTPWSSGTRILSPWGGWPRPHRLERTARSPWLGLASSSDSRPPRVALSSTVAELIEVVVDPWFEPLQNHTVGTLHLPIRHGMSYGGPVHTDVVVVAEVQELFSVNCVPLSVMIEFGTSKR